MASSVKDCPVAALLTDIRFGGARDTVAGAAAVVASSRLLLRSEKDLSWARSCGLGDDNNESNELRR